MKGSHPKMPKLIDLLDQYYHLKLTTTMAELLLAHNTFSFKENWSELDNLIEDVRFHGSSNISILVSSSFVETLARMRSLTVPLGWTTVLLRCDIEIWR
uniref:Uncharacterized protein n=1 Tax=Ditylenchus dipsaci TaxID=166011 RepID=A0A915DXT8_9BILA